MVKDAEAHSEDDKAKKEQVMAHNELDSLVYQTEKLVADNGDKVSEEEKTQITELAAEAKKALEANADAETLILRSRYNKKTVIFFVNIFMRLYEKIFYSCS